MSSIFISHASQDEDFVALIERVLRKNGFDSYFLDHASILIGDKWAQALRNAAQSCRVVLCLVTENWLSSLDCYGEFMAAYYMGKRIVPLFHLPSEPTRPEAVSLLRRVRSEHQGYDLTNLDLRDQSDNAVLSSFEERLVVALRAGGALGEVGLDPAAFAIDTEQRESPFPGLQSFEDTDADAAVFFGRSADIARCLEDIRRMRADGDKHIYALVGASGSGKSSLLKAGVLPRLRRERGWFALRAFTPGSDPLLEFCNSLLLTATVRQDEMSLGHLRDKLVGSWKEAKRRKDLSRDQFGQFLATALIGVVRHLYEVASAQDVALLVTVDQAEQLLRLQSETSVIFCDYLQAMVLYADQQAQGEATLPRRYLVAMTLRTDNLDEFQASPLFSGLRLKAADVRSVPAYRMAETIEGPARRYQVTIDRELVEVILQNLPQADPLPLVAFMIERMWRLYRKGDQLRKSAYEAMGGLDGLIAASAERALAGMNPEDEKDRGVIRDERSDLVASQVFVPPLAQVDSHGATIRKAARWSEFGQDARVVLEHFIAWRLVVVRSSIGERGAIENTVEVAHEALFRSWPRLVGWISREKRRLQELRDLQDAALDWEREGRGAEYCVHQGGRLRSVEDLISIRGFAAQLTDRDDAYIQACRKRRTRVRLRNAAAGLMAGLVLLITVIGAHTWFMKDEMSLIATRLIRDGYPGSAAKFAVAGLFDPSDLFEAVPTVTRRRALLETGFSFPIILSRWTDFSASKFLLTKDGSRLVVKSSNDAGSVWDVPNRRPIIDLDVEGSMKTFYVTRDEEILLTVSADDAVSIWNLSSGERLLRSPAKTLNSGAWSASSKRFASLSEDGTCILWDLSTGRQISILGDPDGIEAVKISDETATGRVVTHSAAGSVDVWKAADGSHIATLVNSPTVSVISRISRTLTVVVFTTDGKSLLFDVNDGRLIANLPTGGRVLGSEFAQDGTRLITRSVGNSVALWDGRTGRRIKVLGSATGANWRFSPDGRVILTRTTEGGATIWNAESGEALLVFEEKGLRSFDFSESGGRLAVTSYGGAATLWNVDPTSSLGPASRKLAELAGEHLDTGYADAMTFSKNGRWLAVQSTAYLGALWDAERGRRIRSFDEIGDGGGAFSEDGSLYASSGTGNNGSVFVSETGERLGWLGGNGAVGSASINGGVVATSTTTDALTVWSTSSSISGGLTDPEARRAICSKNYDHIGVFSRRAVASPEDVDYQVQAFVVGRPWNPCDWRGLASWEGWKQQVRYWLVFLRAYPDYRCGETTAFSSASRSSLACEATDVGISTNQNSAGARKSRDPP